MRIITGIVLSVMLGMQAVGEMRTWTSLTGETITAEYVRKLFDDVVIVTAEGRELRIPLRKLSESDLQYLESVTPPKLKIDFRKSERQKHVKMSPHVDPSWQKYPPTVLWYQFGARVKKMSTGNYSLPMNVVIYTFSQQRYDPDKYHLMAKIESDAFFLNEENDGKFEFMQPKEFRLIKYELNIAELAWLEPRGEEYAESLVLVRDQRGEVIAYNTTKNWLYENMDKLEKLPVGAWLDDTCTRVHPTSPKSTKVGEPIN